MTSARVREMGGVLLIATHAIHPHDITEPSQLRPLMRGDRTLAGWVELESVRARRPKPSPPKTGTTFVLHYGLGHLTVGPLLAHTTDDRETQPARHWARQVISGQGEDAQWLLDWEPVREDDPWAG